MAAIHIETATDDVYPDVDIQQTTHYRTEEDVQNMVIEDIREINEYRKNHPNDYPQLSFTICDEIQAVTQYHDCDRQTTTHELLIDFDNECVHIFGLLRMICGKQIGTRLYLELRKDRDPFIDTITNAIGAIIVRVKNFAKHSNNYLWHFNLFDALNRDFMTNVIMQCDDKRALEIISETIIETGQTLTESLVPKLKICPDNRQKAYVVFMEMVEKMKKEVFEIEVDASEGKRQRGE